MLWHTHSVLKREFVGQLVYTRSFDSLTSLPPMFRRVHWSRSEDMCIHWNILVSTRILSIEQILTYEILTVTSELAIDWWKQRHSHSPVVAVSIPLQLCQNLLLFVYVWQQYQSKAIYTAIHLSLTLDGRICKFVTYQRLDPNRVFWITREIKICLEECQTW